MRGVATGLKQGRPNCIFCAKCTFQIPSASYLLIYASPDTHTPVPFGVGWFDPVWGRKLCPPECPAEHVGRGDESAIVKVNSL